MAEFLVGLVYYIFEINYFMVVEEIVAEYLNDFAELLNVIISHIVPVSLMELIANVLDYY